MRYLLHYLLLHYTATNSVICNSVFKTCNSIKNSIDEIKLQDSFKVIETLYIIKF